MQAPEDGWRRRNCKPGMFVPPFKKRRAPSHLNTQVKDPGYMKLSILVGKLAEGIDERNAKEKVDEFYKLVRFYLHRAGMDFLRRIFDTKILAELVAQELRTAKSAVAWLGPTFEDSVDKIDLIVSLFPTGGDDRDEKPRFDQMKTLVAEVQLVVEEALAKEREELEKRGGSKVEWSDEDEF